MDLTDLLTLLRKSSDRTTLDRATLERLRAAEPEALREVLGRHLPTTEVDAIMAQVKRRQAVGGPPR